MKKVIGIDIGGTKINAAVINQSGEISERIKLDSLSNQGRDSVLNQIIKAINALWTEDIKAIGIATAGFIDSARGVIVFSGNIKGWTGFHLKEAIEEKVTVPVFVNNDANIAALCEKWLGAAKPFNQFVMLTMGTGLGGAIYDKRIEFWEGNNFQGAELGHLILYPKGRLCTCHQKGCAECYIAGSSLALNYRDLTGEKVTSVQVIERLKNGDESASTAIEKMSQDIGIYLSSIKNIFDPPAVIIGGGFIEAKAYWWDLAMKAFQEICNRPEGMEIIPAAYQNDSGVIGAGKLALDRVEYDSSRD